jgi:hypothetical protein
VRTRPTLLIPVLWLGHSPSPPQARVPAPRGLRASAQCRKCPATKSRGRALGCSCTRALLGCSRHPARLLLYARPIIIRHRRISPRRRAVEPSAAALGPHPSASSPVCAPAGRCWLPTAQAHSGSVACLPLPTRRTQRPRCPAASYEFWLLI